MPISEGSWWASAFPGLLDACRGCLHAAPHYSLGAGDSKKKNEKGNSELKILVLFILDGRLVEKDYSGFLNKN